MADVQFAPPVQRLTSPPHNASNPPPPPLPAPEPAQKTPVIAPVIAAPVPSVRLSAPAPVVRDTSNAPAINFQEFLPKPEPRPTQRKKKRSKKLLTTVVLLGLAGGAGYYFRDVSPVQKLLGRHTPAAPLPEVPFVRPAVTSAEYSIMLSAVQNGVPNNVTTLVKEDYAANIGQSTVESQIGGAFTTTQEIRTVDAIFHPGQAFGKEWSRQPRVPEAPSPYDTVEFLPMIEQIIDQPLRDAMKPTSSMETKTNGVTISSLTYVIARAKVPEIAPAIFERAPWLFDVPNATTLTVNVTYDATGLVRHLFLGVDPPQPGTGSGATWVTSYSFDVTALNAPVDITVPLDVVDVPVGTP
ncbi:MAG: hypothetical protein QOE09_1386 [Ilumatobacteraceae bacterium]|jgi:hypothetical protein